jgi:hypothetical protein
VNNLNPHPPHISIFLKSLIKNLSLTVTQYDALINYLTLKKQEQLKIEIGENFEDFKVKQDEKNLQDKIYQVLSNKIPVNKVEAQVEIVSSSLNRIEKEKLLEKIRSDERIRNVMKNITKKVK